MPDTKWYSIEDLYHIEGFRIKHTKTPKTKWIRLKCVYKIKIGNKVVHVGRSDTCKKHGGADLGPTRAKAQWLKSKKKNPQ